MYICSLSLDTKKDIKEAQKSKDVVECPKLLDTTKSIIVNITDRDKKKTRTKAKSKKRAEKEYNKKLP